MLPSVSGRAGRSRSSAALALLAGAASAVVALPAAYLGGLTGAALVSSRHRSAPRAGRAEPTRFWILVPAHDEESTVAETVTSLLNQDYPSGRMSVHVVADHCTDSTVAVAGEAGADVWDHASDLRGKGPALNWLLTELSGEAGVVDDDWVVVVDADTVAEPDFLLELDREVRSGAVALQAYYGVRAPGRSPAVALRFAALAARHHLRPLGRNALGLSSGLYGNGMAFRKDVLTAHPWTGHLVEDAELQVKLLLDGMCVGYVPAARVAAEMPDEMEAAAGQNERWETGRWQVATSYGEALAARAVRGGSLPRRAYVDALFDQFVPPLSLLATLDLVALGLAACSHVARPTGRSLAVGAVAVAANLTLGVHVLLALRGVRAPASVYRSLLGAPAAIVWKLRLLVGLFGRVDGVEWNRTRRNEEVPDDAD